MKNMQDYTISLELSRKLKKLGFRKESSIVFDTYELKIRPVASKQGEYDNAYIFEELFEELPKEIAFSPMYDDGYYSTSRAKLKTNLTTKTPSENFEVSYIHEKSIGYKDLEKWEGEKLIDLVAEALIWCIQNGYYN